MSESLALLLEMKYWIFNGVSQLAGYGPGCNRCGDLQKNHPKILTRNMLGVALSEDTVAAVIVAAAGIHAAVARMLVLSTQVMIAEGKPPRMKRGRACVRRVKNVDQKSLFAALAITTIAIVSVGLAILDVTESSGLLFQLFPTISVLGLLVYFFPIVSPIENSYLREAFRFPEVFFELPRVFRLVILLLISGMTALQFRFADPVASSIQLVGIVIVLMGVHPFVEILHVDPTGRSSFEMTIPTPTVGGRTDGLYLSPDNDDGELACAFVSGFQYSSRDVWKEAMPRVRKLANDRDIKAFVNAYAQVLMDKLEGDGNGMVHDRDIQRWQRAGLQLARSDLLMMKRTGKPCQNIWYMMGVIERLTYRTGPRLSEFNESQGSREVWDRCCGLSTRNRKPEWSTSHLPVRSLAQVLLTDQDGVIYGSKSESQSNPEDKPNQNKKLTTTTFAVENDPDIEMSLRVRDVIPAPSAAGPESSSLNASMSLSALQQQVPLVGQTMSSLTGSSGATVGTTFGHLSDNTQSVRSNDSSTIATAGMVTTNDRGLSTKETEMVWSPGQSPLVKDIMMDQKPLLDHMQPSGDKVSGVAATARDEVFPSTSQATTAKRSSPPALDDTTPQAKSAQDTDGPHSKNPTDPQLKLDEISKNPEVIVQESAALYENWFRYHVQEEIKVNPGFEAELREALEQLKSLVSTWSHYMLVIIEYFWTVYDKNGGGRYTGYSSPKESVNEVSRIKYALLAQCVLVQSTVLIYSASVEIIHQVRRGS